jgi:glutamine amidotransferase
MCELLGMNANVPTDIRFSFTGLIERGGRTGPHRDGWGIAFYEGKACRSFHDPQPGAHSVIADLVREYPIKSLVVLCHIRQATHGRTCLENTHPFTRELWGRSWSFAHNGRLKGIKRWPLSFYKPIGTTDSEHAFCWILDQLRARYPRAPGRAPTLWRAIARLAHKLDAQGVFNMLMSDSRCLYTYCSTDLAWLTRRAPFGEARLIDTDLTVDFSEETTPRDVVTVVATRPLTDNETWNVVERGTLIVFRDGGPVAVRTRDKTRTPAHR